MEQHSAYLNQFREHVPAAGASALDIKGMGWVRYHGGLFFYSMIGLGFRNNQWTQSLSQITRVLK